MTTIILLLETYECMIYSNRQQSSYRNLRAAHTVTLMAHWELLLAASRRRQPVFPRLAEG